MGLWCHPHTCTHESLHAVEMRFTEQRTVSTAGEGGLDKTGPSVASKGISVHPTCVQKYLTASVLVKYPVVVEIIS